MAPAASTHSSIQRLSDDPLLPARAGPGVNEANPMQRKNKAENRSSPSGTGGELSPGGKLRLERAVCADAFRGFESIPARFSFSSVLPHSLRWNGGHLEPSGRGAFYFLRYELP